MKLALSPVGLVDVKITECFLQFLQVHHADHALGTATLQHAVFPTS